jgi:hypothetical protein
VDRRRHTGLLLFARLRKAVGPRFLLRDLFAQRRDKAMLDRDLMLILCVDADFVVVCAAFGGISRLGVVRLRLAFRLTARVIGVMLVHLLVVINDQQCAGRGGCSAEQDVARTRGAVGDSGGAAAGGQGKCQCGGSKNAFGHNNRHIPRRPEKAHHGNFTSVSRLPSPVLLGGDPMNIGTRRAPITWAADNEPVKHGQTAF